MGGIFRLRHQFGVLMRRLANLRHGNIHLADAGGLLLRCDIDFTHQRFDLFNARDDVFHGAAGLLRKHMSLVYAVERIGDQRIDLFRRLRAAACQRTHFGSHDREAFTMLTGARRLYRRVQRQNVGLEGDRFNHVGNIGDALRGDFNRRHGIDRVGDLLIALLYGGRRFRYQLQRLRDVCRILIHRRAELFHAGRGFLHAAGLAGDLLADIFAAYGDGVSALANFLRGGAHLRNNTREAVADAVDGGDQLADFVIAARLQRRL